MSDEFTGSAEKIQDKDFEEAAETLGCDVAAVRAVVEVEAAGSGFLKDKRPKILFESRWFSRRTDGRYDHSHPDISTPKWVRNYKGGAAEYGRLEKAMGLDRAAALQSVSWGLFQILGVNHKLAGFADVDLFVGAQVRSEGEQLRAFVNFVRSSKLDDELRDRRWADFARGYNGPGYRQNRYDEKLAAAYEKYAGGVIWPSTRDVQLALVRHGYALEVDGITGPRTREALRGFQQEHGLARDGVPGPQTLAALGLFETADPVAMARNMEG